MPKEFLSTYSTRLKAFTLVEILVVIGIITILSALVITALNPSQLRKAARDTNRRKDISVVSLALEQYYAANNRYPNVGTGGFECLKSVLTGVDEDCSSSGDQSGPVYIKSVTMTQSEQAVEYCYDGSDQDYVMCAPLEAEFEVISIGGNGSSCTVGAPTGSTGAEAGVDFGLYCLENPF